MRIRPPKPRPPWWKPPGAIRQLSPRLYQRYVTPVYRYLYKWAGSAGEAEDLTSQVFTEVLEGLARYQERGNFAAWLFTIARRKAIAAYRRRRPNLPLDEAVAEPAEDLLEQVVQGEVLERMAGTVCRVGRRSARPAAPALHCSPELCRNRRLTREQRGSG